jgi:hypothetical protein
MADRAQEAAAAWPRARSHACHDALLTHLDSPSTLPSRSPPLILLLSAHAAAAAMAAAWSLPWPTTEASMSFPPLAALVLVTAPLGYRSRPCPGCRHWLARPVAPGRRACGHWAEPQLAAVVVFTRIHASLHCLTATV